MMEDGVRVESESQNEGLEMWCVTVEKVRCSGCRITLREVDVEDHR